MRLIIMFTGFILGLISASPGHSSVPVILDIFAILLILIADLIYAPLKKHRLISFMVIYFLTGRLWMACLPTWPDRLVINNLEFPYRCVITGHAVAEAFECGHGRFLPVAMDSIRTTDAEIMTGGNVLVQVRNDFVGVPGATYRINGFLDINSDKLHSAIISRFKPRALIKPPIDGFNIVYIKPPDRFSSWINNIRYQVMSHLSWGLDGPSGELLAGITFGRKSRRFGGDWARDFCQAGLSHLIVASGAQVSLLFLPMFFLLARWQMPKFLKWALLVILAIMLEIFIRMVGSEPSILRAGTMGFALLFAIGAERRTFELATLSAAGFIWLIVNPLLVRDTGFLLSFAATFGIIYLGQPMLNQLSIPKFQPAPAFTPENSIGLLAGHAAFGLQGFLRLMIQWAVVTFSAQFCVFPVLACTIGRISTAGFVANLVAVPLAQIIMYLGALSGIGGFINPAVSLAINRVLENFLQMLMDIARYFSDLPYANISVEPYSGWFAAAWFTCLVIGVETWRFFNMKRIYRNFRRKQRN